MYLTGAGGTGKSKVIFTCQAFCCEFSRRTGHMFDNESFLISANTGAAAALLEGNTIHASAHLNAKKISDDHNEEWKGANSSNITVVKRKR